MAFRDDRDALLARTDSLQRENDQLERDLANAAGERDELRRSLAHNQKELAALRKKLARLERPAGASPHARLTLIVGLVAMLVMGAVVWVILSRATTHPAADDSGRSTSPAGDRPATPAPDPR